MTTPLARPRSVVLDADSTLSGIEGIDWLATLRPPAVAEEIARLTREAMEGTRALEEVYGARLEAVVPTRDEVRALGAAYVGELAEGAGEFVRAMQDAGTRVVMVSGGIRQALLPLGDVLGIGEADIHAVELRFDPGGTYAGFDQRSPLTRHLGKATCVRALRLPRHVVAVGDGSTDLVIRSEGAAEAFVAFTGFARRREVVAAADAACGSFGELLALLRPAS